MIMELPFGEIKPIYRSKGVLLYYLDQLIILYKHESLKIIFSPEFLTERTSKLDMLTQSRRIEVISIFIKLLENYMI